MGSGWSVPSFTSSGNVETYAGLTYRKFKTRLGEHKTHKSALVGHVWDLKNQNKNFTITWKKLENAKPFNPISKKCRLCLREKFHIMYRRENASLNKRNEVFNTCRYRKQSLLSVVK